MRLKQVYRGLTADGMMMMMISQLFSTLNAIVFILFMVIRGPGDDEEWSKHVDSIIFID